MGAILNLVLLEPAEVAADGSVVLVGRRARHIVEVHRAQSGDSLRAGVVGGRMGTAKVESISPAEVRLTVTLNEDPPEAPGIDLLLALPRPKVLRRVLALSASLGIKRVVLINAARVERSYFDSPALQPSAIREELIAGLEQARDTILPEVLIRDRFRPFIEDELPGLWPASTTRIVADPAARQSVHALSVAEQAVIAIGPEGGWVPFERSFLDTHGFEPLSLGARVLRVETAIPMAFGQILSQQRRGG